MSLALLLADRWLTPGLLSPSSWLATLAFLWTAGLLLTLAGTRFRDRILKEKITLTAAAGSFLAALGGAAVTGNETSTSVFLAAGAVIMASRFLTLHLAPGVEFAAPEMPRLVAFQATFAISLLFITALAWWFFGAASDGMAAAAAAFVLAWPHVPELMVRLAAKRGLISARSVGVEINGLKALNELSAAEHIAFDKPALLERDTLVVTDVQSFDNKPEPLLSVAASVENQARHPIASAIRTIAGDWGVAVMAPEEYEEVPGLGCVAILGGKTVAVGNAGLMKELSIDCFTASALCKPLQAEGKICVLVALEGRLVGLIALQAAMDGAAPHVLSGLKTRSVGLTLVTGTEAQTAAGFGKAIGVERVISDIRQGSRFATAEAGLASQSALFVSVADSGRRGVFSLSATSTDAERLLATLEPGHLAGLTKLLDLSAQATRLSHRFTLIAAGAAAIAALSGSAGLVPLPIAGFLALGLPFAFQVAVSRQHP
ncbi:HAD family hydrolase [Roseibium sp.]|uniref:HAD family hydrolase n=1 Tax=Roseibium sp. TaxID=1936156 RepID=UPI003A97EB6B